MVLDLDVENCPLYDATEKAFEDVLGVLGEFKIFELEYVNFDVPYARKRRADDAQLEDNQGASKKAQTS